MNEELRRKRKRQRKIWLVWAERPNQRGIPIVDLRAVEETKDGADFVVSIIKRDESESDCWTEERITHHIYAHRDLALARRFARIGE